MARLGPTDEVVISRGATPVVRLFFRVFGFLGEVMTSRGSMPCAVRSRARISDCDSSSGPPDGESGLGTRTTGPGLAGRTSLWSRFGGHLRGVGFTLPASLWSVGPGILLG